MSGPRRGAAGCLTNFSLLPPPLLTNDSCLSPILTISSPGQLVRPSVRPLSPPLLSSPRLWLGPFHISLASQSGAHYVMIAAEQGCRSEGRWENLTHCLVLTSVTCSLRILVKPSQLEYLHKASDGHGGEKYLMPGARTRTERTDGPAISHPVELLPRAGRSTADSMNTLFLEWIVRRSAVPTVSDINCGTVLT